MANKGPDIHFDYGWACPIRVEGDSSIDFTDETVVFRWGVVTPDSDGELDEELGSITLAVSSARTAVGTVPRSDTRVDPDLADLGYNTSVGTGESAYLVNHGRLVVKRSVGGGG